MKTCIPVLLCLLLFQSTYAQDTDKTGPITVSLNISSVPTVHFSGKDTAYNNSLSISPVFDLRGKSGWGASYSPSILASGYKKGVYMHSIGGGYESYGKKNFDLAFTYTHYIFTNKTSVPYTPLNNELFFSYAYTKSWLKPIVAASFGFGKDSAKNSVHDVGIMAGLGHDFSWENTGAFSTIEIDPSIVLNAGTNQYFSFIQTARYLSHSHNFLKYIKKGGLRKKSASGTSTTGASLELSNMELNLENSFELGSFSIHPTGSLFFPVSSGTDNSIYGCWQLSLQYHF